MKRSPLKFAFQMSSALQYRTHKTKVFCKSERDCSLECISKLSKGTKQHFVLIFVLFVIAMNAISVNYILKTI